MKNTANINVSTDVRDQEICAAYYAGETMTVISKRYGVSKQRICQIVRKCDTQIFFNSTANTQKDATIRHRYRYVDLTAIDDSIWKLKLPVEQHNLLIANNIFTRTQATKLTLDAVRKMTKDTSLAKNIIDNIHFLTLDKNIVTDDTFVVDVTQDVAKLHLSVRARNVLYRNHIFTIQQLQQLSYTDVLNFRNCGAKTALEINYKLRTYAHITLQDDCDVVENVTQKQHSDTTSHKHRKETTTQKHCKDCVSDDNIYAYMLQVCSVEDVCAKYNCGRNRVYYACLNHLKAEYTHRNVSWVNDLMQLCSFGLSWEHIIRLYHNNLNAISDLVAVDMQTLTHYKYIDQKIASKILRAVHFYLQKRVFKSEYISCEDSLIDIVHLEITHDTKNQLVLAGIHTVAQLRGVTETQLLKLGVLRSKDVITALIVFDEKRKKV